jgi:CubicO group peptidase (beta-lactamase class C family)
VAVALLATAGLASAALRPDRLIRLATRFTSQTLCSSAFVSGLDADRVFEETVRPALHGTGPLFRYRIDRKRREVVTRFAGAFEGRAVFRGGQGCSVWHPGFEPPEVRPAPSVDRSTESAPLEPPDGLLERALARAFAEPDPRHPRRTKAIVVLLDDRVVAERYASGYAADTPLPGYSLTKSAICALVGILVREGRLSVEGPAPVAAWSAPGDPRHAITIDHLLRMTSGLALEETDSGFDVVSRLLFLEPDMAAFAARATLRDEPGRRWRYTTGNTLILSGIVRDTVGGRPDSALRFADRELFGPLRMRDVTLEVDAVGAPTFMYAPAREWARLFTLFRDDGVTGGRRVLPEGFVRYATSRTLDSPYAAGFWLGADGWRATYGVPTDLFFGSGRLGQQVIVIPSARLVIARFGVTWGPADPGDLIADVCHAVASGRR